MLRKASCTRPRAVGRISVALTLVTALWTATSRPAAASGPERCRASFQPDTVTIRQSPTRVLVRLTEAVGEVQKVYTNARSGIDVFQIEPDTDQRSWIIGLELGDARAGSWRIELVGTEGSCRGQLVLEQP